MLRYAMRRMLLAVPTLLAVLTLVFVIVRIIPGDPATAVLGDYASKQAVDALRERMGLNQPLWKQYVDFLVGLLQGDLGTSLITSQPVIEQVRFALPYTLELTGAAILIGLVIGVPLGLVTAIRRNSPVDYVGRIVSLVGVSVPSFFLGLLFIYLFAVRLDLFPAIGAASFSEPLGNLHSLVLPAVSLGLIETAYLTRMIRSVVINILHNDHVRTARAKGLSHRHILSRHVLRPALIPIVSLIGLLVVSLIGNSVLIEEVFGRPGVGKLMVGATKQRDYTTLQSIMAVYTIIIVASNLLTDLSYVLVDPRVRYEK